MGNLMGEAYRNMNRERTAGIQVERRISHEDMVGGPPYSSGLQPPHKNPSEGPKTLGQELKEAYLYTNSKEFADIRTSIIAAFLKTAKQGMKEFRYHTTSKEVRYKDQIMKWLLDQEVNAEWKHEQTEGSWIDVKVM